MATVTSSGSVAADVAQTAIKTSGQYGGGIALLDTNYCGFYAQSAGADLRIYTNVAAGSAVATGLRGVFSTTGLAVTGALSATGTLSTTGEIQTGAKGVQYSQSTTGVTSTTTDILAYSSYNAGGIVLVSGADGGAQFMDIVGMGYSTAAAIQSNTIAGSPAARTYTASAGVLRLSVASGTYAVRTMAIKISL